MRERNKKEIKSDILNKCVGPVRILELVEVLTCHLALPGTFRMIRFFMFLALRGPYQRLRSHSSIFKKSEINHFNSFS